MTITAKYPGRCTECGGAIKPGDRIDWDRNTKATRHVECPKKAEEGPYRLSGGSGYGDNGWTVGQVLRNSKMAIDQGEPEYLVVVTEGHRYYREDGMSFGVGDEQGYAYWATCREATAEEAQSLIEKRQAAERKANALKVLKETAKEIRTTGEKPEDKHRPEGETVNIGQGQNIYGGGEWFVVGQEHIWYVRNNGADGDYWAANNVVTGGAGAIGWRVPATDELAEKIRTAAEAAK